MISDHTNPMSTPVDSGTYFFNSKELARLSVYRMAVIARFYTDQLRPGESAHVSDTELLALRAA